MAQTPSNNKAQGARWGRTVIDRSNWFWRHDRVAAGNGAWFDQQESTQRIQTNTSIEHSTALTLEPSVEPDTSNLQLLIQDTRKVVC